MLRKGIFIVIEPLNSVISKLGQNGEDDRIEESSTNGEARRPSETIGKREMDLPEPGSF